MFERFFGSGTHSSLIEAAFRDFSEMLQQSIKMLELSLAALLDNEPLEVDLENMDDRVDEGERMVRRTILEHLAVNPQKDLVVSLVLASMVHDAERIGDGARGLAELIPLADGPRSGPFRDELRELAQRLVPLFGVCSDSFAEDDPEKARQVIMAHTELKEKLLDYTRRVAASGLPTDMAVVYSGAARILRRISAHLSNIASSVVQPYDRIRHGDEEV
jgi:phosphate transport system protein